MSELIITRGISGSGKSTWAKAWVAQDSIHRAEVNRDSIRLMMHDGHVFSGNQTLARQTEAMVTVCSQTTVKELLKRGTSVVVSDTNLPQRAAREWAKMARFAGADFEVKDFSHIPLEICLARNGKRTGEAHVPAEVIERQYARFIAPLKGAAMPLPVEDEGSATADFVEYDPSLDDVYIVDIDGTVALKGNRSPFDETRVHEDRPNQPVIDVVHMLYLHGKGQGNGIVFLSGRTDSCRDATKQWLDTHVGPLYRGLYMRKEGDFRKDSIVKRELFDTHIRGKLNVRAVLDDRNQVVDMWRDELGLTCMQVAPGDF